LGSSQTPSPFYAVAQVYENWYDVNDEEVLEILKEWRDFKNKNPK